MLGENSSFWDLGRELYSKLLKIDTTRMQSIIVGCFIAIVMHLTTCNKQIKLRNIGGND